MKKTTGKVLSLVLSLALVLTSFPAMFASASTKHTISGALGDTDRDKIYLVNGGKTDKSQTKDNLQDYIFGDKGCTLERPDHEKETAHIAAISHKDGDRLVKWYDADDNKSSIDDDTTNVGLQLRSSTVKGHETLNILYKATYTDDDGNDVTVKNSKIFDVYVYDKNATVIGKADADLKDGSDIAVGKKSTELDDNFSEKTVSHEIDNTQPADSMQLTVWEATLPDFDTNDNKDDDATPIVKWVPLKTVAKDGADAKANDNYTKSQGEDPTDPVYYVIKSSNSNISLADSATGDSTSYIYATIDGGTAVAIPAVDKTYDVAEKAADATTAGVKLNATSKTKLDVAKSTGDSDADEANAWKYYYKVGADKATTSDDLVTIGADAIDLAAVTDGQKVAVTAFDKDGVEKGTIVVTVKVTTGAPGYAAADCPTIKQDTTNKNSLTVDYTENDKTAKKLTYKYTINGGTAVAINPATGKITVPAKVTEDNHPCTIVVTAYDKDTVKGYTKATVAVTSHANNDSIDSVKATVKKASSGNITFTAEATHFTKNTLKGDKSLSTDKDITVKSKIDKQIKVDNVDFKYVVKCSGSTYVTTNSSLDKDSIKTDSSVKINGLGIKYDCGTYPAVTVSDKASVGKISGKVGSLTISDGSNVDSIALDKCNPSITVSDAKVGDIDFDDVDTTISGRTSDTNCLDVDSTKASVGNVTDATTIKVKSGKTGNLTADDEIEIDADDDTATTTVGDIKSKDITLDSEDSKLAVGNVISKDDGGTVTLKGNNLSVKSFDFDNRDTTIKTDDFQGTIPAPKNASQDGAEIELSNGDDRLKVTGDCDVHNISVEDDSQIAFDGKLNVTSIDGGGTLEIAAGKMYIDGDVSSTILKLTDATLTKGMTAFTAANDCVNADDFDCYGFTLAKSTSSKTDTFKVDTIVFKGLSVNKASSEIAKDYSETFTAYPYPGGTTMPAGYTVKWALSDADDSIFQLTTNANGTATVKVIGYDGDFSSNDKCTLTATLVDPSGDECDKDDYAVGECDLTAIQVPKVTHISDTTKNFSLAQGASYQFKITSSDGSEPTFGVGSGSLAVSKVGKSGNAYFYKVTAVGKVGDQVGVYLDKSRLLVITVSAPSLKLDTGAKLSVAKGKTYQFKATSTAAVKATTGNGAVFQIVKVTKAGNNTFVTIKAVGSKGQCTGIYFNGVRRTIATVA